MFIVENSKHSASNCVNTLNDYTDKINNAIQDIKSSYVYIGGLLNEINSFEVYKELGFESVVDYCYHTFGFKKTFTYDLMNVHRKFNDGTIFHLSKRYEKYDFSKLVVMSRMNDLQLSKCTSNMTVQQIKDIKRNIYPCTYEWHQEQVKQNSARAEKVKVFDSGCTENNSNILYDCSFFAFDNEDIEMVLTFFNINIDKGKYRVIFLPYEEDSH